MKSAFRHVPLQILDFCLLLMRAKNPETRKYYWFVEKCLPFGSSISCKIFQDFSDAVAFIVMKKTRKENVNYLDDFLFIALMKNYCNQQLQVFIDICKEINFPVSMEKTEWACQLIVFLGLLIDNVHQMVCIPRDKIERAKEMLQKILSSKKRKATVLNIQRLAGFLNFLCKCVVPGRPFTLRLYAIVSSKLKPYHHVKIPQDVIQDMKIWQRFLESPNCYCRPFLDFQEWTTEDIVMYSDAAKSLERGFGAYCNNDWMAYSWSECETFFRKK